MWCSPFLPPCVSLAFSGSALVDFRRGSCLSAILRQSPDPGVKECEPRAVTIKILPRGQTMLNTSANALMISHAFGFLVAHFLLFIWKKGKENKCNNLSDTLIGVVSYIWFIEAHLNFRWTKKTVALYNCKLASFLFLGSLPLACLSGTHARSERAACRLQGCEEDFVSIQSAFDVYKLHQLLRPWLPRKTPATYWRYTKDLCTHRLRLLSLC